MSVETDSSTGLPKVNTVVSLEKKSFPEAVATKPLSPVRERSVNCCSKPEFVKRPQLMPSPTTPSLLKSAPNSCSIFRISLILFEEIMDLFRDVLSFAVLWVRSIFSIPLKSATPVFGSSL